jgi:hypothetical protein
MLVCLFYEAVLGYNRRFKADPLQTYFIENIDPIDYLRFSFNFIQCDVDRIRLYTETIYTYQDSAIVCTL